ncbi:UvrD-helicase domain-containing protein [Shumkonia mesophila]|uniref:UvrD-helicase domain-containing protein n=1 Tax=Shumkonia mesophila TaxID=2838854 RepID=UPI00293435A4|nr:UvrD-helicase domain-containing protein [Shumkonia mesophila]
MIGDNKLVIAAAGSGKTTYLVEEAVKINDERVLIATYTESNEAEIRQKFFDLVGHVPANVVIMTWFSFLITHGVKPFQGGLFEFPVSGMVLVTTQSGLKFLNCQGRHPVFWSENDVDKHYFDPFRRVYSDKLPKLAIRCNEKSDGAVIDRISRIFPHVFIDEVQDLAGYDLDILAALARSSVRLLMVGDPRQVTYLTHHEQRYKKYADGGIADFLRNELPKKVTVDIDETTLNRSHRNSAVICAVSSRLFPALPASLPCECVQCRNGSAAGTSAFILQMADYAQYIATVGPMQLRDKITSPGVDDRSPAMNFGESKGRGFDHVVILPTDPMRRWLSNPATDLKPQSRAKFYVALTRARHSVAIAMDWGAAPLPAGFSLYKRAATV